MCIEQTETMRGIRGPRGVGTALPPDSNTPAPTQPDQVDNMRGIRGTPLQMTPPPDVAPQPVTVLATPPQVSAIPQTAQAYSQARVETAAPQNLGGLAAQFTTPVGKGGYSKSLRPEAGRLVR